MATIQERLNKDKVVWAKCDPRTIAPLNVDGQPDTYNYMPTRFITQEESVARGWLHFYLGTTCRVGHKAPRYSKNKGECVDCRRVKNGRPTIGPTGEADYAPKEVHRADKVLKGSKVAAPLKPMEPEPIEKRFLVAYAETRFFAKAAEACGRHESEFLGRLCFSKVFRDAVHLLESDNGLTRTPLLTDEFEWSDDKRKVLARVFIDTGDLNRAMKAVGVTNYHYMTELESNPEFQRLMENSQPWANLHIERLGIGLAADGNERILPKVMAVNNPEYGDRMKLDMNVTQKLNEDQINAQLFQILKQLGRSIPTSLPTLDAEFTVALPEPETEDPGVAEEEIEEPAAESNSDLL
jgi:hypothetical protein